MLNRLLLFCSLALLSFTTLAQVDFSGQDGMIELTGPVKGTFPITQNILVDTSGGNGGKGGNGTNGSDGSSARTGSGGSAGRDGRYVPKEKS